MQHAHYDLKQVEADIRNMYRAAPDHAFSNDPQIASLMRASVDVEVAFEKWMLQRMMDGVDPADTCSALQGIFVNLIVNRMCHYAADHDAFHPIYDLLPAVSAASIEAFRSRVANDVSGYGVDVNPVTSGRA